MKKETAFVLGIGIMLAGGVLIKLGNPVFLFIGIMLMPVGILTSILGWAFGD